MTQTPQKTMFRALLVEDMAHEAELVIHQLQQAGLHFSWRRVETEGTLRRDLADFLPHIILSDLHLPQFDGLSALRVTREMAPATPFIFVSGAIGEEQGRAFLRAGACDYFLKSNLLKLAAAVQRTLGNAGLSVNASTSG